MTLACDIQHTEYIAQLARHMVSVPSTSTECQKRGSVALIVRLVIDKSQRFPVFKTPRCLDSATPSELVQCVHSFLKQPDFVDSRAQVLFIQRAKYPGDPWSGHIGFPGGKREPSDISDRETAERETREELGLDLSDPNKFLYMGRLDDTSVMSFFNRLIMVVSPNVYLQIVEGTPELVISDEVASVHWVDFEQMLKRIDNPVVPFASDYKAIPVDIASRTFVSYRKTNPWWFRVFRRMFGNLYYTVLPLQYTVGNTLNGPSKFNNIDDAAAARKSSSKLDLDYGDLEFATDSELYLWGLSLVMLCNLVDLSLPFDPRSVNTGYISIASPWPQMQRYLWADFNWMVNTAHRYLWGHYSRKPWLLSMRTDRMGAREVGQHVDYFKAYFRASKLAFAVSCVIKTLALYQSSKLVFAGLGYLVDTFLGEKKS
ncbi:hypothetical protein LPJ64_003904 [Coemansia asiatica]|uniref:Nudix hydrolase domain-containing protein n=1 Tax=Coemansia asiatica TaxID=1052880 RepID=A0A9W7XKT6_9FUNG|nr:hypothetical protein LPJ64_003904 [Coemansia asiatica]